VVGAAGIVLLTDVPGVLDQSKALIAELDAARIDELIANGTISGGMIPKVQSALDALSMGVAKCHVVDGRIQHAALLEVFTDKGIGTEILV
jgi:acetylglutamate kinase